MKKAHFGLIVSVLLSLLALTVCSFAAPYVSYWSFDTDAVEEINGLTPSNPESLTLTEGKNGKAFAGAGEDLSGMLAYEDVNIPITSNFTFAAWIKGDYNLENGSYYVMMAKNPKATDGHFEMYWFPDGCFGVYGTNTDEACNLKSDSAFDDGSWHHICVRAENGEYSLYIDGALNTTYSGEPLNNASGPLYIGSLVDNSLPSQAAIDDMFFTDTLIAESDVAALMNDTKTYAYNLAGKSAASASASAAADTSAPDVDTAPVAEAATVPQTSDYAAVSAAILIACAAGILIYKKRSR